MAGHKKVWQNFQCALADAIWIGQSSAGADGTPLGTRDASHGLLSFKYHNLTNDSIYEEVSFGVYFTALGPDFEVGNTKQTTPARGTWQFLAHREMNVKYKGLLVTRLVATMMNGTCHGDCVDQDSRALDLQFMDDTDVIGFDCGWSWTAAENGSLWCDVTKKNSGEMVHFATTMIGPYTSLQYLGVGKKANEGRAYFNFQAPVSDFKVTIFE
jgi:hypothetical protein